MTPMPGVRISKLLFIIGLLNLLIWYAKLGGYFLAYQWPDIISLVLCMIVPYLVGSQLKSLIRLSGRVVVIFMLLATFLIYFGMAYLIQHADYTWVLPNLTVGLIGLLFGIAHIKAERISYLLLLAPLVWVAPFRFEADQKLYFDRLTQKHTTRQGKVHQVSWKGEQWIHYNGRLSAATIDAHLYYEPLVHPAMSLLKAKPNVLLIGGDNGFACRELIKYEPALIHVIPFDIDFPGLSDIKGIERIDDDPFRWLTTHKQIYDAIIIDLPDPVNPDINQYYTLEFYQACWERLHERGMLVTQALSPYFQTTGHLSIMKTMDAAGFQVTHYHNQIPTIGQWGWVIGSPTRDDLNGDLQSIDPHVPTKWWTREAMHMMMSFGKHTYFPEAEVRINTVARPTLLGKNQLKF